MRRKRRYLAVRILHEQPLPATAIINTLRDLIARLFGSVTLSEARILPLHAVPDQSIVVIGCDAQYYDLVRGTLSLIHELEGQRVGIDVVKASGTIRGLRRLLREKPWLIDPKQYIPIRRAVLAPALP